MNFGRQFKMVHDRDLCHVCRLSDIRLQSDEGYMGNFLRKTSCEITTKKENKDMAINISYYLKGQYIVRNSLLDPIPWAR
jgi:hypothetical protein